MPTIPHEAPLLLLRERPSLIAELLQGALGLVLPAHTDARIDESDFTQLVPAESRADLVVTLLRDAAPVMGIVVETQLARKPEKRFTWPLYAAALHARLRCPTALVVIAPDDAVARWAAKPIATLQLGSVFLPIVIDRARIPVLTSPSEAARAPELAVLSALAHGGEHRGIDVARVALGAAASLDEDKRALYTDLVLYALSAAARGTLELEMNLRDYEFKSDFFKEKFARAEAKVAAETEAGAVLTVLAARGIAVPDAIRAAIVGTTDIDLLYRWLRRAATVATAEDVLRDE
jgi:hypothetical protein